MQPGGRNPSLEHLEPLVGDWDTEATHPALANVVIRGSAKFEWLAGGSFLVWRSHHDHPDIPDAIAILGCSSPDRSVSSDSAGEWLMHYFDSRGVSRVYGLQIERGVWRFWRNRPGFSQRYACTVSADGGSMSGRGELSTDGSTWEPDLQVTYHRVGRR